jgi:hypothetical protein
MFYLITQELGINVPRNLAIFIWKHFILPQFLFFKQNKIVTDCILI